MTAVQMTVPDALRHLAQQMDDGDFAGLAAVVLEKNGVAHICAFDQTDGADVRAMLVEVGAMLCVPKGASQ